MDRRPRVIVFDDDRYIRLFLEQLFTDNGCEVITYEDPSLSPLQHSHDCQCDENEYCADIVITDIDMPNISGLDFIEGQVRKGCKLKNIAVMSGLWSQDNMERANKLGCAVFEKPVPLSALADWLHECLERIEPGKDLSDWFLQEK